MDYFDIDRKIFIQIYLVFVLCWMNRKFVPFLKIVTFFIGLLIHKCNALISDCPSNDPKWDSNDNLLSWNYTIMLWKTTVKKYLVLIFFVFYEILLPMQSSTLSLNTTGNNAMKALSKAFVSQKNHYFDVK